MFAMTSSRPRVPLPPRPWLIGGGILLVAVAVGYTAWSQRWAISGRAVAIVDPVVRRWAAGEVDRLSGGVYHLTASTIVVGNAGCGADVPVKRA